MDRRAIIVGAVGDLEKKLNAVGKEIWLKPEISFQEHFAHKLLSDFLEECGFQVQRNYILPTAFRAEFSGKKGGGPTIAVLCEYDALPGIGHACGHNLIAQTGIAAGIAIKAVLEQDPTLPGKVVVMGTPAEEGGGGKILLLKGGAFKDVDVAMMAHPTREDFPTVFLSLCLPITVKYKGKSSHASGSPWVAKNALDAAVACYLNISLLRQQMKPSWRINVVITKGGEAVNVIPDESELKLLLRTSSMFELEDLRKKAEGCFSAAAEATDCQAEITIHENTFYKDMLRNSILEDLYAKHATSLGINIPENIDSRRVSTDLGNVSYELPALHPTFKVSDKFSNHTKEFAEVAGRPESQRKANVVGTALAMTAVDLLADPQLLSDVQDVFQCNSSRNKRTS